MSILHVVGAAILRDATCLIAQRSPRMSLPGKWEFPGGKVEPGEAPEAALMGEIQEELGLEIEVGTFLGRGTAQVDGKRIALDVFAAHIRGGTLVLREHAHIEWVTADALTRFDWAEADIPVVGAVRAHLHSQLR